MMFTECDWAFFIRQYGDDVRAQQSDPTLLSYGLDRNNTEWATEAEEQDDQDL